MLSITLHRRRSIESWIIFFCVSLMTYRFIFYAIRHLNSTKSNFYTINLLNGQSWSTDRINKCNKFGYFRRILPLGKKTNRPNRGIYMKITGEYPLYIPTKKKKKKVRYLWFQITGENSEICFFRNWNEEWKFPIFCYLNVISKNIQDIEDVQKISIKWINLFYF